MFTILENRKGSWGSINLVVSPTTHNAKYDLIMEGLPRRFMACSFPSDGPICAYPRQSDPAEPGKRREDGGRREASSGGGVPEEIQAVKH